MKIVAALAAACVACASLAAAAAARIAGTYRVVVRGVPNSPQIWRVRLLVDGRTGS